MSRWRQHLVVLALLVCGGIAAYWNSFSGVFLFDDASGILADESLRSLWPLTRFLHSRGFTRFTFALNHAIGGREPRGYHLLNLVIHLGCAVVLYSTLERLFVRQAGLERTDPQLLAGVVALIWVVHPLTTEAVTYIVQRFESLMSLFYLLTLYAAIRCCEDEAPRAWGLLAVVCCFLGMISKEVMVSAPLVVLLYDRSFVAGSWGGALRRRWWLYAGFAGAWAFLLLRLGHDVLGSPDGSGGFLWVGTGSGRYALSQPRIILHYLRLAIFPWPLCIDYGWPVVARTIDALPSVLAVGSAVAAAIAGVWRRSLLGFLGAAFFLVLSVTSSFMPIADLAVEHRMYLPLAFVLAMVVLGARAALAPFRPGVRNRVGASGLAIVVIVLIAATHRRNRDYSSERALWESAVAVSEMNPRAHCNLGLTMERQGDLRGATRELERALELNPQFYQAQNALGYALYQRGDLPAALQYLRRALELRPRFADAEYNLGLVLFRGNDMAVAVEHLQRALEIAPNFADAHEYLGIILAGRGEVEAGMAHLRRALEINPNHYAAHNNLGLILMASDQEEALRHFERALEINPAYADAHRNLGFARAQSGDLDGAVRHLRSAVELAPLSAESHAALGAVLMQQGILDEGLRETRRALRLDPRDQVARQTLATYERR